MKRDDESDYYAVDDSLKEDLVGEFSTNGLRDVWLEETASFDASSYFSEVYKSLMFSFSLLSPIYSSFLQ